MAGIQHGTLVANTVTTVTVDRVPGTDPSSLADNQLEVINRDGAAEIFYTLDGVTAPTVGGSDCEILPAAINGQFHSRQNLGSTVVKLISSGTPKYTVKGV